MKVFYCTDFQGRYPVGCAAIVRASSKEEAALELAAKLGHNGLPQSITPEKMIEWPNLGKEAIVLNDGDY